MRLLDGATPSEGKVAICYYRRWGTVCNSDWGTFEAGIVCRQLEFESIYMASSFTTSCNNCEPFPLSAVGVPLYSYGRRSSQSYHYHFSCTGDETHLSSCPASFYSSSRYAAEVICLNGE